MSKDDLPVKISIKLGDQLYERDFAADIAYSEFDLIENMIKQAPLYAYYATKLAEADSLVERYEFEVDRALGLAISLARARLISEGASRITDKQLEAEAKQDETYLVLCDQLFDANHAARMLKAATRSLEHKRETMTALSYTKREEIKAFGVTGGTVPPSSSLPPGIKMPQDY